MEVSIYDKIKIDIYLEDNNLEELELYSKNRNIKDYNLYFLISKLSKNKEYVLNKELKQSIFKEIEEIIKVNVSDYSICIQLLINLNLFKFINIESTYSTDRKEEILCNYSSSDSLEILFNEEIKKLNDISINKYLIDDKTSLMFYIKGCFYYKKFKYLIKILNKKSIDKKEISNEFLILINQNKYKIKKNSITILNKCQYEFETSFELFSSTPNNYRTFLTKSNYSIPYLAIIYLFQYNSNKNEKEKYAFLKKALYFSLLSLLNMDITYDDIIIKYILKTIYNKELDAIENNIKFKLDFNKEDIHLIKNTDFKLYIEYFSINRKKYIISEIMQISLILKGYCLLYGRYNFEKNEKLGEKILQTLNTNEFNSLIITILDKYEILKNAEYLISFKKKKN